MKFKHHPSFFLRLLIIVVIFAFVRYRRHEDTTALWWILAVLCVVMAYFMWRSGLIVWEVGDDALRIRRPLGVQVIPWKKITGFRLRRSLRLLQVIGDGRVLAYTSTDGFPDLERLCVEMSKRALLPMSKADLEWLHDRSK